MPYEISFDKNNRIVKLQIFGDDKKEDHHSARIEAFHLCKKHRCPRLLVDLRKLDSKSRNTLGCFEFGESVVQTFSGIKIAHVLPVDILNKNDIQFISNIEYNRGINCQEFDSIKKAINWLID